jgi:hypothetical protein
MAGRHGGSAARLPEPAGPGGRAGHGRARLPSTRRKGAVRTACRLHRLGAGGFRTRIGHPGGVPGPGPHHHDGRGAGGRPRPHSGSTPISSLWWIPSPPTTSTRRPHSTRPIPSPSPRPFTSPSPQPLTRRSLSIHRTESARKGVCIPFPSMTTRVCAGVALGLRKLFPMNGVQGVAGSNQAVPTWEIVRPGAELSVSGLARSGFRPTAGRGQPTEK